MPPQDRLTCTNLSFQEKLSQITRSNFMKEKSQITNREWDKKPQNTLNYHLNYKCFGIANQAETRKNIHKITSSYPLKLK